jgi:CheY-like chemotaxis protein
MEKFCGSLGVPFPESKYGVSSIVCPGPFLHTSLEMEGLFCRNLLLEVEMAKGSEGRWVLVVDDNPNLREAISRVVALLGFEVAQASNGTEALALFAERGFDLILTDFQMPGMDGLRLASRIKDESPTTPVVLITGSMRGWVEKRMGERPVDRIVYKPFGMDELVETVVSFTGLDADVAMQACL